MSSASPFPGMDPYLQSHWRDVHTRLMVYAVDQLQEQLPADLLARVEEGVEVDWEGDVRTVLPDVRVEEDFSQWPPVGDAETGGLALASAVVAEPLVVPVDDTTRRVEIIDSKSGNRVVTVIEILSPTNKQPGSGMEQYRRKQLEDIAGGVNLVEVDLIRGGAFALAVPESRLTPRYRTPFLVCVRRRVRFNEAELYRAPLEERLPAIRIPLRPVDKDAVLDLQALINQCYVKGRYNRIDYREEPDPPFLTAEQAWADPLLRQAGRRP